MQREEKAAWATPEGTALPRPTHSWALLIGCSILTPNHQLTQDSMRTTDGLGKGMESTLRMKYPQFTEWMT